MKQKHLYFILGIMFTISAISCTKEGPYTHYSPENNFDGTTYDFLKSQPEQFKYLLLVLDKAGLTGMLQEADSLTFFVPTDQSLLAAMNKYNVYRKSQGLLPVEINDIDSSSWRYILLPYITKGVYNSASFKKQDGLMLHTMALRDMHGKTIQYTASGVVGSGPQTIKFTYLNGSRFSRNWISADVAVPNIISDNGIVHILGNRHVLGFTYFINKAGHIQNIYSEARVYATGQIVFPDKTLRLWQDKVKRLVAIDSNTIETEAADLLENGYGMRLTILPDDSIVITPAPWSTNLSIKKNGPCYFDPKEKRFVLQYRYEGDDGYRIINEKINYVAESDYIH